jgi:hypothetical protein
LRHRRVRSTQFPGRCRGYQAADEGRNSHADPASELWTASEHLEDLLSSSPRNDCQLVLVVKLTAVSHRVVDRPGSCSG